MYSLNHTLGLSVTGKQSVCCQHPGVTWSMPVRVAEPRSWGHALCPLSAGLQGPVHGEAEMGCVRQVSGFLSEEKICSRVNENKPKPKKRKPTLLWKSVTSKRKSPNYSKFRVTQ